MEQACSLNVFANSVKNCMKFGRFHKHHITNCYASVAMYKTG